MQIWVIYLPRNAPLIQNIVAQHLLPLFLRKVMSDTLSMRLKYFRKLASWFKLEFFLCGFEMKLWSELSWKLAVCSNVVRVLSSCLIARGAITARMGRPEIGVVQVAWVVILRAELITESSLPQGQLKPQDAAEYATGAIIMASVDVHQVAVLAPQDLLRNLQRSVTLN